MHGDGGFPEKAKNVRRFVAVGGRFIAAEVGVG